MSKINKAWHDAHVMPKNPTVAERIAWHLEHAQNCGCRPIPEGVARLIAQAPAKPPQ